MLSQNKESKGKKEEMFLSFLCGLYGKTVTVYPEKVSQTKLTVLLPIHDTYRLPLNLPPTLSPTPKELQ